MYEDEGDRLKLDFETVSKFGRLSVSPPVEVSQFKETQQALTQLRDALKIKGELEQTEAKAKYLHDATLTQTDEYKEAKEEFDGLDKDLKKKVENIRYEVRFGRDRAEDGVEIDEDYNEQDVEDMERRGGGRRGAPMSRMTDLKPSGNRGGRGGRDRNDRDGGYRGSGNRGYRGGRRGGRDDRDQRQSNTDYLGREVSRGRNRRDEDGDDQRQQRPRGNRGGRGGRDLEMDEN